MRIGDFIRIDDVLDAFEDMWPRRLANNIRWGSALCRAYATGYREGSLDEQHHESEGWYPGCGHPATGRSER